MVVVRRVLWVAVFVLFLAGGWSFALGNGEEMAVDYLLGVTPAFPLWLLLVVACGLGLLVAGGVLGLSLMRRQIEIRRLRKAVRGLESELHQLRNSPVSNASPDLSSEDTLALAVAGVGRGSS